MWVPVVPTRVSPSYQPTKAWWSAGVAVTLTREPCAYLPAPVAVPVPSGSTVRESVSFACALKRGLKVMVVMSASQVPSSQDSKT